MESIISKDRLVAGILLSGEIILYRIFSLERPPEYEVAASTELYHRKFLPRLCVKTALSCAGRTGFIGYGYAVLLRAVRKSVNPM